MKFIYYKRLINHILTKNMLLVLIWVPGKRKKVPPPFIESLAAAAAAAAARLGLWGLAACGLGSQGHTLTPDHVPLGPCQHHPHITSRHSLGLSHFINFFSFEKSHFINF